MAKLKATKRTEIGSNAVKRLRQAGSAPAIVYGHGEEPQAITISQHDVDVALIHGERVLELDLDGKAQNVLIKDVQWDTFEHEILHVDFARVNLDERVEVTVPVTLAGTPAGAKDDGVLQQIVSEVTLECAVRNIPEEIRMLINDMELNDRKYLKDLELPEGAKLIDEPEDLLCQVTLIAEEVEAEEGEEPAAEEPEVIGAREEEETEGEESSE
jgi:large subunit ribosomal protein L25